MKIVVICENCGRLAPFKIAPDGTQEWLWHQPCENCGAECWVSHDPSVDWRTGRPLKDFDDRDA